MYWRIISHDTEKRSKTLKKNWLFIWKMTWGIWWTVAWAVESLKICTLMEYFCRKYVMFELKIKELKNIELKNTGLCHEKWLAMVSKTTQVIWWLSTQVVESNVK